MRRIEKETHRVTPSKREGQARYKLEQRLFNSLGVVQDPSRYSHVDPVFRASLLVAVLTTRSMNNRDRRQSSFAMLVLMLIVQVIAAVGSISRSLNFESNDDVHPTGDAVIVEGIDLFHVHFSFRY